MVSIPLAFAISLVVALICTPIVGQLARRIGAVDDASLTFRKSHSGSMPRLGGLAIAAGFYVPLVGLLLVDSEVGRLFRVDLGKALGLLVCGLPVLALGVWDDLFGARAPQKLLVQVLVAVVLYFLGFRIGLVQLPLGPPLEMGIFALPVTVIWVVGLINALNLIDGLDGLASGVAFFAGGATLMVAFANDQILMMLFMAALTGAVAGFLFFNFNPATIFMGDSGSMFLGYVMAVTSLQTSTKGAATVALLTPVLALGLPIMDTLVAMARRVVRGQSMFQGDQDHVHHRLVALGLSHRTAVLVLYAVSLLFGLAAMTTAYFRGPGTAAVLAVCVVVVAVGIRVLWWAQDGAEPLRDRRRRNERTRAAGALFADDLRGSETLEAVWHAVERFAQSMGATHAELRFGSESNVSRSFIWHRAEDSEAPLRSRSYLLPRCGGALDIGWNDGRPTADPQEEIALEAAARATDDAVARIRPGPVSAASSRRER